MTINSKLNCQTYSGHENLLAMRQAKNYNHFLDCLIEKNSQGACNVMDFGAGIGLFAKQASTWAKNLICVESDLEQVDVLKQDGYKVFSTLAEAPEHFFDYIYTLNVLEHIQDDSAVLCQLKMRLRVGGSLLIYVPAMPSLYSSMDSLVGHCRRYTKKELSEKVELSGLTIKSVSYEDPLGALVTLLYKYFGNSNGEINLLALKIFDRIIFPISRMLGIFTGPFFGKNLLLVCKYEE